jgi:hypothetical protein
LVKKLASSEKEYDALVLVGTQLEQLKGHVDDSVMKHLQAFSQVNKRFDKELTLTLNDAVPGKRLVSIEERIGQIILSAA